MKTTKYQVFKYRYHLMNKHQQRPSSRQSSKVHQEVTGWLQKRVLSDSRRAEVLGAQRTPRAAEHSLVREDCV